MGNESTHRLIGFKNKNIDDVRGILLKILRQLCIILAICFAGEMVHRFLNIPVPGNVIGMIILFICLCTGIIKLDMIGDISSFLIDHLAFFFLPAGVGLIACIKILGGSWIAILVITLAVTVIVMVITGHTVQLLMRSRKK